MQTNTSRRRKSCNICLLLTASGYFSPLFVSASSSPHDSSYHPGSIQQVSTFAKRGEPSTITSTIPSSRNIADAESYNKSADNDTLAHTESGIKAASDINQTKQKSSISLQSSRLFSILPTVIINSAKPLLQIVTFTAQVAIAAYLTKVSWNVIKEAWDEINEEYAIHYRKGAEEDGREEQDLPFVDSNSVSNLSDGPEINQGGAFPRKSRQNNSSQMVAMRDLATRLRSAGIPYASEVESRVDSASHVKPRTIETVIQSLSRSEGNVLSQTLLTPMDDGGFDDQEQDSVVTRSWNAIGGLAQAKESLLDLAFPLLPSSCESNYYGGLLANPPGVLLYGPPGCGKSMLVRALANTVGARFLVVSPSCLLRKYVGETNLNVRALFSVAAKISPCVIFVDELDGLFRERGGEDHDVSRDLKTEFLQLWDGIRHNHAYGGDIGASASSVLVIGATNRPFDVDPAFLRRMPRRIFIGLPDYDARVQVLTKMLEDVPRNESFDIDIIAKHTQGYSPSDLREVLQTAALYPLREARSEAIASQAGSDKDLTKIQLSIPPLRKLETDDVLKSLQHAKPTHFSKTYSKQLIDYVQRSGGARDDDSVNTTDHSPYVTDSMSFSSEYYSNEDLEESSYDDESESDDEI